MRRDDSGNLHRPSPRLSPVRLFAAFPCCSAHSLVNYTLILPETCGASSSQLSPSQFPWPGPTLVTCPFETPVRTLRTNPRQEFTDPSMWGYHVRFEDFPYDNRPVAPLQQYTFDQWWFVSVVHSTMSCRSQIPTVSPLISTVTWALPLQKASSLSSPPVIKRYRSWLATRVPPSSGQIPMEAPMFVRTIILVRVTQYPSST